MEMQIDSVDRNGGVLAMRIETLTKQYIKNKQQFYLIKNTKICYILQNYSIETI